MGWWAAIGLVLVTGLAGILAGRYVSSQRKQGLLQYTGVYRWSADAFVYFQMWREFTGTEQLVAFDESGEVRTLYPAGRDSFFTGPGAALEAPVESRIGFQRDAAGRVISLTLHRQGDPPRVATRVQTEQHEEVRFRNGDIRLSGTLISPGSRAVYPAIILVHGSGPADRWSVLPYARFLIRHGFAVLCYDKRGSGASTGDWTTASFDDLARDVEAAFHYLKTRRQIDGGRIGLLGISQAGWIMPIAAVRGRDIAFMISISGAGVTAAETTIDHARNEMLAAGTPPDEAEQIISLMKLQYSFARTGQGWPEYLAARKKLVYRMGSPSDAFPGDPENPLWQTIRRLYFYDPAPVLRRLQTPTLAIYGKLDNNIMAEKNRRAVESALKAGGNPDYELHVFDGANHLLLEAKAGNIAEMVSSRRFVPAYFSTVRGWLAKRIAAPQNSE